LAAEKKKAAASTSLSPTPIAGSSNPAPSGSNAKVDAAKATTHESHVDAPTSRSLALAPNKAVVRGVKMFTAASSTAPVSPGTWLSPCVLNSVP
jgi:hypothetical protein